MLSENGASKVVIFDFDEKRGQAVASSMQNGLFCKVDVSNEDSVKAGFEMVRNACGRLDIMVNSAGIVGPNGLKADQVNVADFDKVYEGKTSSKCMHVYSRLVDSRLSLLLPCAWSVSH